MSHNIMGVSAARGTLLAMRQQLKFIKKGKEILEMKRDRIAGELNQLLPEVRNRIVVEDELMEAYNSFVNALIKVGIEEFMNNSKVVSEFRVRLIRKLVMGVEEFDIEIESEPNVSAIPNPVVQDIAMKLYNAFLKMIKLAETENKIEALALDLMNTARKVNALDKIVIPMYEDLVRYIEDRLMEDMLEEFVRTKYIVTRKKGVKI
ncbi:hypothetical protein DRN87_04235 [Candidatus Geothermarchaeota archaeon]|nr:MAG: hypothetical protein DRN87_04235 [Candidatus Geothermarchaeota archaeon]HEW93178.1 V-type ATP synthase subunit D [Thermoprotei archaeon]